LEMTAYGGKTFAGNASQNHCPIGYLDLDRVVDMDLDVDQTGTEGVLKRGRSTRQMQ